MCVRRGSGRIIKSETGDLFISGAFVVGLHQACFKKACFEVEFAATDETRRQGLMNRKELGADQGMLFVFDTPGVYSFGRKNTLLSLDMIWLDADKRVVHIEADVPPCIEDPCSVYSPGKPATYVLELPAGTASRRGIGLDSILLLDQDR